MAGLEGELRSIASLAPTRCQHMREGRAARERGGERAEGVRCRASQDEGSGTRASEKGAASEMARQIASRKMPSGGVRMASGG